MEKLVLNYIEKLELLNFEKEDFIFQIKGHPSFPSLNAITDVLSHYNIDNMALEIPVTKENLLQLPKDFLALINLNGRKIIVLVSNDNNNYNITLPDNEKQKYGIKEFQKIFTGILIVAEKNESFDHTENSKSDVKSLLWILTIISVFSAWVVSKPDLISSLLLVTSLIGVLISILILKKEFGINTTLGNAFCSGVNKKNDCDTVINSDTKLFNIVKLSDISLIYFLGLGLLVFLIGITTKNFSIPYIISLLAVTITLYSIYYQYYILKAWCGLCLSILILLWIQAGLIILNVNTKHFSFGHQEFILTFASFFGISATWIYIKPIIESLFDLKNEKIKFFRFKRNFKLFNTLLNKKAKINTDLANNVSEMVFGSENNFPITIVTNPYCGHCREVHKMIDNIVNSKYYELTKIVIRFNIDVTDINADVVKITSRLLEIFEKQGEKEVLVAMDEIYSGDDPKNWLIKWGEAKEPDRYIKVLQEESDWCYKYNINFTPEILLDGRPYPKEYERNDLVFFLEELYEDYIEKTNS